MDSLFYSCPDLETFETLKFASDNTNTEYFTYNSNTIIFGNPDVKWNQICFVFDNDSPLIYAKGKILYNFNDLKEVFVTLDNNGKIPLSYFPSSIGDSLNINNTTTGSLTILPNTLYSLGALTGALTITLDTPISNISNTYNLEFDINDDAATPTKVPNFPANIVWKEEPVWTTGKHYEISIRYSANTQAYYGMFVEFDTYIAS